MKRDEERHHFPFYKPKSPRYERFTIFEILFVHSSINTADKRYVQAREVAAKRVGNLIVYFFVTTPELFIYHFYLWCIFCYGTISK